MKASPDRMVAWIKNHPWRIGITSALVTAILGTTAEAIVSGTRSYAWAAAKSIILGWHPFPAAGWVVIIPIIGLGIRWIWERSRRPTEMPDESHGVRWRCQWNGGKIISIHPVCPNPNCGRDLSTYKAGSCGGSPDGLDTVFACDLDQGCGLRLRHENVPGVVFAEVRRDLENQAMGQPPAPEKPLKP